MSYRQVENSRTGATPVELYEFNFGAKSYLLTNHTETIEVDNRVYSSSSLKRNQIVYTSDSQKDSLTFTFPRDAELTNVLFNGVPDTEITINVLRGHLTDGDKEFQVYWKGRVVQVTQNDTTMELNCESVFTSVKRIGLRATFELNCRHSLYGSRCGVNRSAHRDNGSLVNIIDKRTIEILEASNKPDGWYLGGFVEFVNGSSRAIVAHSGIRLTLSRSVEGMRIGQQAFIYPGCDRTMAVCESRFNNLDNHGGFPYIPAKNPFSGSSIV